jgi:hypothetical protein
MYDLHVWKEKEKKRGGGGGGGGRNGKNKVSQKKMIFCVFCIE